MRSFTVRSRRRSGDVDDARRSLVRGRARRILPFMRLFLACAVASALASTACGRSNAPSTVDGLDFGTEADDAGARTSVVDAEPTGKPLDASRLDATSDTAFDVAAHADASRDSGDSGDAVRPAPDERTLFVGNSFTYVNDLPGTYATLATPIDPEHVAPYVASSAYGGYTLVQHLADAQGTGANPELQTLLGVYDAGGKAAWNHVVLQEQSEIPGFDLSNPERAASMSAVVPLSSYVAATGATSVLYMTWGYPNGDPNNPTIYPDYPTMQGLLETGYRQMAQAIVTAGHPVLIAPVGLAFEAIHDQETAAGQDPLAATSLFMQLYGPDQIHPSVPGTFLAACVMVGTMYGVDPTTLDGSASGVDAASTALLEAAARDVVATEQAMASP